ncbi:MAG: flagellar basal body-associated FliL family protein [Agarilytica sp.]
MRYSDLRFWFVSLALVLLVGVANVVNAEDEAAEAAAAEESAEGEGEEGAVARPQAIYLPLKPPFVMNYGGTGRLRYLKAEVSVRLNTVEAANAVRRHMPWVRNNLNMLFASQTNDTVSSQDGREKIRVDALEEIRNVVEREERIPREDVMEVFFNNFIVQK